MAVLLVTTKQKVSRMARSQVITPVQWSTQLVHAVGGK